MRNSNRPYVICHMLPSIDGRRETIYSQRVYQQNLDFMYGRNDWRALLTRYPTDMALVRKPTPSYRLMATEPEWLLLFEDARSALFVSRHSPLLESLRREAPPVASQEARFFP